LLNPRVSLTDRTLSGATRGGRLRNDVWWRRRSRGRTLGTVDDVDQRLERAIGELLDRRRPEVSICPSEAARAVDPDGWRELMPAARAAAGRLAAAGAAEVTQAGVVVDVATAHGPVRIRRPLRPGQSTG
jgi:hypothetical protein